MAQYFDHEKLIVYQKAIQFVSWCEYIRKNAPKTRSVIDQLDRASTSVCLNIAEGNGKFSSKDRCRFWDIARASALESAACLDVMAAKEIITLQESEEGKAQLKEIVSMLMGLFASFRVSEDPEEYGLPES